MHLGCPLVARWPWCVASVSRSQASLSIHSVYLWW